MGRDDVVAQLAALIDSSPLVTVVGTGGAGKTRTAVQLGIELLDRWPDGVWFVDLASLTESAGVVPAIAAALGVQESSSKPVLDSVVSHLRTKRLLLIVDNCEHVIDEVAVIVDALQRACPDVRILATSREPLRVAGEAIYRIPSLTADGAVALFIERARAVGAIPTDASLPLIAQICGHLDGLPLAVELAAARVRTLTIADLARRLDARFTVLTGGDRLALPRQRTMHALVDWSYDLLDENERTLFARLAVFPGAFGLDAAIDACSGGGFDAAQTFDVLASLVDKSLVVLDADGEETRYRLLETTREYALAKLHETGEYPAIAHRHALAYLRIAEELDRRWYGDADRDWFPTVERELDNFRTALDWAKAQPDATTFLRLVAALARIWYSLQPVQGARWIAAALERVDAATHPAIVARLAIAEAELHESRVQFKASLQAAERARAVFAELGDRLGHARASELAGTSLVGVGSTAEGERLLHDALAEARALDSPRLIALALGDLGVARNRLGDTDGAREAYAEALAHLRRHGFERQAASVAGNLAEVEFGGGDPEAALRYARSALDGHLALGNTRAVAIDLFNMAAYFIALDRFDEARVAAVEALGTSRELGAGMFVAFTLQHLAAIAALQPVADAADTRGRRERAQSLVGFVDERFAEFGGVREYTERQEYERLTAALLQSLGAADADRLAARGRGWSEDRAVAEAVQP